MKQYTAGNMTAPTAAEKLAKVTPSERRRKQMVERYRLNDEINMIDFIADEYPLMAIVWHIVEMETLNDVILLDYLVKLCGLTVEETKQACDDWVAVNGMVRYEHPSTGAIAYQLRPLKTLRALKKQHIEVRQWTVVLTKRRNKREGKVTKKRPRTSKP